MALISRSHKIVEEDCELVKGNPDLCSERTPSLVPWDLNKISQKGHIGLSSRPL